MDLGPSDGANYWAMDELTGLAMGAREGDRAALERFVRASQADVWRLCAHLGGGERADDLCQETFIRAIGALRAFRGESSARTWLLSIARRVCADDVRRNQRRRALFSRLSAEHRPEVGEGVDHRVVLDELLRDLEPDRRDAFVLTQMIGLSYEETAVVCGCPVGTVRSRVSRARADLVAMTVEAAQATHPSSAGNDS